MIAWCRTMIQVTSWQSFYMFSLREEVYLSMVVTGYNDSSSHGTSLHRCWVRALSPVFVSFGDVHWACRWSGMFSIKDFCNSSRWASSCWFAARNSSSCIRAQIKLWWACTSTLSRNISPLRRFQYVLEGAINQHITLTGVVLRFSLSLEYSVHKSQE